MILQIEALELHKLENRIIKNGGYILRQKYRCYSVFIEEGNNIE
jgi:hypothetical protein